MNKKVITGGIIAVAVLALIIVSIVKSAGSSTAFGGGSAFAVNAVKIEKGEISSSISSSGVIEEVEKAEVFFDTPLRVNKILAESGQRVSKGQKILELDIGSLNSELEKLKVNKNIQELSMNSTSMDAEVERAASAVKSAERNFSDCKTAYSNNKELYAANAISKNELDMSQKAYIESESALNNARLAYQTAVESRNINSQTSSDNYKLTNLSIADLEKKIQSVNEGVLGPIDGVVAEMNVQEGSFTSSMQSAFKVINPDRLQVRANIKEYDIKNVAVGQEVKITGDAIDKNTAVNGKVSSISPVAVASRTASGEETVVEVVVAVEGAGDILKPGLNVTCDVFTVQKEGVLLAPMGAINEDKDGNKSVYVINTKNNTMVEKRVKLGITSDMNVEVLDGLNEGDLVVSDTQPMYKDGSRVRILEDGKK